MVYTQSSCKTQFVLGAYYVRSVGRVSRLPLTSRVLYGYTASFSDAESLINILNSCVSGRFNRAELLESARSSRGVETLITALFGRVYLEAEDGKSGLDRTKLLQHLPHAFFQGLPPATCRWLW